MCGGEKTRVSGFGLSGLDAAVRHGTKSSELAQMWADGFGSVNLSAAVRQTRVKAQLTNASAQTW